jgi:hypothetical protein
MAYFFFIDESGTDRQDSLYEVLCGVAIKDTDLWNIVTQLKNLEEQLLGTRYSGSEREIKGKKFLKRKVFRQAGSVEPIPEAERTQLSKECIENGATATKRHLAALAQAKLEYVKRLLELCAQFRIKVFASISSEPIRDTDDETLGLLRRDIADLIAYIISWGLRIKGMKEPARQELDEYVELIKPLRYRTTRDIGAVANMEIWSITYVK